MSEVREKIPSKATWEDLKSFSKPDRAIILAYLFINKGLKAPVIETLIEGCSRNKLAGEKHRRGVVEMSAVTLPNPGPVVDFLNKIEISIENNQPNEVGKKQVRKTEKIVKQETMIQLEEKATEEIKAEEIKKEVVVEEGVAVKSAVVEKMREPRVITNPKIALQKFLGRDFLGKAIPNHGLTMNLFDLDAPSTEGALEAAEAVGITARFVSVYPVYQDRVVEILGDNISKVEGVIEDFENKNGGVYISFAS